MSPKEFMEYIGDKYITPSSRVAKRRWEAYEKAYKETSLLKIAYMSLLERTDFEAIKRAMADRDNGVPMLEKPDWA